MPTKDFSAYPTYGQLYDEWFGFKRPHPVDSEPGPSFEERVDRCKDMGLLICTCSSVEREEGRVMLYRFDCPIHRRHGKVA